MLGQPGDALREAREDYRDAIEGMSNLAVRRQKKESGKEDIGRTFKWRWREKYCLMV